MGITCLESEIIISKSEMNNSEEFDSRVPSFIYICHNATKQAYVWMSVIITWTADHVQKNSVFIFSFIFWTFPYPPKIQKRPMEFAVIHTLCHFLFYFLEDVRYERISITGKLVVPKPEDKLFRM